MPQRVTLAQALELAIQHHNAGRLTDAEDIYKQILVAVPKNHDALHLLGLIANERGDNEDAASLIGQAIELAPEVAEMHGNLGLVLQDLGRLDEAVRRFERATSLNPDFAEGHNNLGLAYQDLGRLDDAVANFERALTIDPQFAEAHSNLGNARKAQGRLEVAADSHRRAIEIAPGFAEAHNNLGIVLLAMGRLDESAASFRKALSINTNYAEAHSNLGNALQEQGGFADAVACYRKALAINPKLADAHANLGAALTETGDFDEAFASHRKAVALAPKNDAFWIGLAACVERLSFEAADEALWEDLLQLLDHPAIDPQSIAPAILNALRLRPDFGEILARSPEADYSHAEATLSENPLLLRAMALSPFKDLEVEAMLTALRGATIDTALADPDNEAGLPFAAAMAHHCHLNEYVFSETGTERTAVERLEGEVAALLDNKQRVPPTQLVALAAYRPLGDFPWAGRILNSKWPDEVREVIARQITEPCEESELRADIPPLTAIEDDVSRSVRAQYEENPYPRWSKFAARHRPAAIGDVLRGAPLRFAMEGYQSPERPEVLIAGCGTGQQALLAASRYEGARILAVDLSLSSLSYAMRKTRELGVSAIEYAQADIMALDGLDRRFDLIESVGVLHHLRDPLAGWKILAGLLRDGGVMKIGLYSEAARRDVVAARALIAERGYEATPDGIHRCREDIAAMARDGDTEMASITRRNSFFTTSECRDLMFHVQEHRFTLPQIETALQSLGLKFLGFEMRDRRALRRFNETYPDALTALDSWHAFELDNPETFSGMYQFWVRKR